MVNNAVVSHNSVNELYYLEEVDSTNTWAKANLDKFGPVGAVYTTSQTAGRGRRGHTWINASGQALYYTVVLKTELAQPESLPLFASMAVADALEQRYGIQESMTNFGFDRALYGFEREGFAAIRDAYKARCVNLGRHVTFDGGEGTAVDVDEEGRLVVQGAEGSTHVFTGEVSVHGIYGAV